MEKQTTDKNIFRTPYYTPLTSMHSKNTWKQSSPFQSVKTAFNWLNVDYPVEHDHTHWEIQLIASGKIQHTLNGKVKVMNQGDACLIRPNDRHFLTYCSKADVKNYQSINFIFTHKIAEDLFAAYDKIIDLDDPQANLYFSVNEETLQFIVEYCLIAQAQNKHSYQNISTMLINRLLLALFEANINKVATYPDWLNDFIKLLHSPLYFSLNVQELAKLTPYSYSRLNTIFKKYTGTTILSYVNELKLTYAKRLLRTSDKAIIEISNELFYDSVSSFNHNFKNRFGETPSQYRKHNTTLNENHEIVDKTK